MSEMDDTRTVEIPRQKQHGGFETVRLTLTWRCPVCGGRRGEPFRTISYDGSRRLACDGWINPCGHVDSYESVRRESQSNQATPPAA